MIDIVFWILIILMTPYFVRVTRGFVRWLLEFLFSTNTVTISYTDKNGIKITKEFSLNDEKLDEILDLIREEREYQQSLTK